MKHAQISHYFHSFSFLYIPHWVWLMIYLAVLILCQGITLLHLAPHSSRHVRDEVGERQQCSVVSSYACMSCGQSCWPAWFQIFFWNWQSFLVNQKQFFQIKGRHGWLPITKNSLGFIILAFLSCNLIHDEYRCVCVRARAGMHLCVFTAKVWAHCGMHAEVRGKPGVSLLAFHLY